MNSELKTRLLIAALFMATAFQSQQSLLGQSSSPVQAKKDIMNTSQFSLLDYRKMMKHGTTPTPEELVGFWHGVNKGIVERVGQRQFVKEIKQLEDRLVGDNVQVHQVAPNQVRLAAWQPKSDSSTGEIERRGKFEVQKPSNRGRRGNCAVISYRDGDNSKRDPCRLLVDKVVKLDDNHMLGRATANFGPIRIPLAYFVLERTDISPAEKVAKANELKRLNTAKTAAHSKKAATEKLAATNSKTVASSVVRTGSR